MSVTILRTGLWIVLIVLAGYVLRETYAAAPFAELLNPDLLQKAGMLGVALVILGVIVRFIETVILSKVPKSRCSVCRRPINTGEFYCREHLRRILEDEHDKTHGPVARKRRV